jgi:DNA mismatch repair protein MutS2
VRALGLLNAENATIFGLDWLEKALAPLSPYGWRRFAELVPFGPGEESAAQSRAERIAELAGELGAERVSALRGALTEAPDVSGTVARASMGELLEDPDLFELLRFCEIVQRVEISNEATRDVARSLASGKSLTGEFYLADAFDSELAAARDALADATAELESVRGRERDAIARALGRAELAGDEFIVMRHELAGALPRGIRVVREATTYLLCEIEHGDAFLTTLERRDEAFEAVAQTEERVRARLSAFVRERATHLDRAAAAIGELDVTLAAAAFAQHYQCTPPIVTHEARLAFSQGRFLPLEDELLAAGRRITPIDLELDGAAVLTGPNMGGKSVTLQTCGFLALLASFGLPAPAVQLRVGLFESIAWLGLGREERAGGLLSSFAQELVTLKEILAGGTARLLLLADEFARTTTPHEGRALVVALLQCLQERNACALAATHLQGIAGGAGVRHFAVRGLDRIPERAREADLPEALARLSAAMDYRIVEVTGDEPPQADAVALAELLGLDGDFVAAAYRALSQ